MGPTLRLQVEPTEALVDQRLSVKLAGAPAGTRIRLRARASPEHWQSEAEYEVSAAGTLDLETDAPLAGDYEGPDSMGLVWSMRRPEGSAPNHAPIRRSHPWTVRFEALLRDEAVAEATTERLYLGDGVTRDDVREAGLVGSVFRPADSSAAPVVIVLGGSEGGLDERPAALLASRGYPALALAYFGLDGLPKELADVPLEYVAAALGWLDAQFPGRPRVLFGTSMGGQLALLAGATFPRVRGVICTASSGIMTDVLGKCAWTYRGKRLPFVRFQPSAVDYQAPVVETTSGYLAALSDREQAELAQIPVERIQGPVLFVSGSDDRLFPSSEFSEIAFQRLVEHRVRHDRTHLRFDAAGHAIALPNHPCVVESLPHPRFGIRLAFGGTQRGTAIASRETWAAVLGLLGRVGEG